ncbi:MAG: CDP-alcohol phosphatidyltransferase family protein [Nanoarchaeota archaeon]|nr:CDP-alcohol phosphatidyltransferase family protein [Nanoarchaeota archaeon]MBU1005601.1 CDP-alcohol phosphatidyltransferase family protein [Nanoarchaeota archaeon]
MTSKPSRSLWFRYFCEPIGWRLAPLLVKTPITGNQISVFVSILTVITCIFISYGYIFTGAIILQIILILDTMDGTLARLKKQASLRGKYLEAVWHEAVFPLFYFALGIYSYKALNNPIYIMLGAFTSASIPIINLLFHRYTQIFEIKETDEEIPHTTLEYIVRWLTCPSHTFTYCLILAFFNWIPYMVIFYFTFYALLLIYKFIQFVVIPKKG